MWILIHLQLKKTLSLSSTGHDTAPDDHKESCLWAYSKILFSHYSFPAHFQAEPDLTDLRAARRLAGSEWQHENRTERRGSG